MKVLHVVTLASATGKYGGPFDTATRQAVLAAEMGIKAKLFAGYLRGDRPGLNPQLTFETEYVPARLLLRNLGFSSVGSLQVLARLLQAVKAADVIHVHAARELIPLLSIFYARAHGKPYVIQSHGMLTSRTSLAHRAIDVVLKPLIARASSMMALTHIEAEELRSWLQGKHPYIHILGNPLPKDTVGTFRAEPRSDEALFVARLHKRKRVSDFISAAAMSGEKNHTHRYVVVGPDGGDLKLVEAACQDMDHIRYEGAISADQVSERVERTGVFVLTSEHEPWGNVVAIALACGVPIVLPRSAALSSMVEAYRAGYVYEDDKPGSVSELVNALLTDRAAYSACSQGALRLAASELSEAHQKSMLTRIYTEASCRRS